MSAFDVSVSPLISHALKKARAVPQLVVSDAAPTNLPPPEPKQDKLTIHGIPESEMTPAVKEAVASLMDEVKLLRTERVRLNDALRKAESLADTDSLAMVYNRRAFMREMNRVMSFSQRYDIPSSLIFFDLNGFKAINDTYGHGAGDAIIKGVASALSKNVRESDLVGRVGGDEFAVLLAKATPEEAQTKAQGLAAAIDANVVTFEGMSLTVRATYGLHNIEASDNSESAMATADANMYANKLNPKILAL